MKIQNTKHGLWAVINSQGATVGVYHRLVDAYMRCVSKKAPADRGNQGVMPPYLRPARR